MNEVKQKLADLVKEVGSQKKAAEIAGVPLSTMNHWLVRDMPNVYRIMGTFGKLQRYIDLMEEQEKLNEA